MSSLESVGTDARTANGYVVVFTYSDTHTAVLAVLATTPRCDSLNKLRLAIETFETLRGQIKGFEIKPQILGKSTAWNHFEIQFAIKKGPDENRLIELFLKFALQSRVLTNPIVTDLRNFKLE
jgi:hypothetical protein